MTQDTHARRKLLFSPHRDINIQVETASTTTTPPRGAPTQTCSRSFAKSRGLVSQDATADAAAALPRVIHTGSSALASRVLWVSVAVPAPSTARAAVPPCRRKYGCRSGPSVPGQTAMRRRRRWLHEHQVFHMAQLPWLVAVVPGVWGRVSNILHRICKLISGEHGSGARATQQ